MLERGMPGEELVEHRAEAVDVGARVHRVAAQLLGRGVRHRAEKLPVQRQLQGAGDLADVDQPEIDDLEDVAARHVLVADDVGRLEIAVHDAGVMRELQGAAQRGRDVEHLVHGQLPVEGETLQQAGSVEVLHHQEGAAVRVDVVIEHAHDVGMAELCGSTAFAQEPLAQRRVVRGTEDLHRDVVAKQDAAGPIDRSHAAAGEQLENLVTAVDDLACREHAVGISYDFSGGLPIPDSGVPWYQSPMRRLAAHPTAPPCFLMTADPVKTNPVAPLPAAVAGTITYTVQLTEAWRHLVVVDACYPTDGRQHLELMMAVWTPGSYLVREYARHVEGLEVIGGAAALPVKTSKNRWRIATDGAERVTVRYRVYGREMSVRTNWVESRFALLQGAATYLTLADGLDRPHRVTVHLPDGWVDAVSGLPGSAGPPHVFEAGDYDTLVDSPIVAGDLTSHAFEVDGTPHVLVDVDSGGTWDGARASADLERIVAEHQRLWGSLPYDRFVFVNLLTEAAGGLEHRNSTVLMTSRWAMGTRQSYLGWLGLASHELFHVWNGKRLRPAALGPFDYEHENYTPSLWAVEGFTSYYGDLLVRRAGLSDDAEYLQKLSTDIRTLETTPGRHVQSLTQSSHDAWIKLYRPDENSANTSISYYTKGEITAALLDAGIRLATQGQRSLDDVLRLAFDRHAGSRGFTEAQVREVIIEVGGADLGPMLQRALDTTAPLDYRPLLDAYGLEFQAADSLPSRGWLGLTTRDDDGRLVVTRVQRDAPGAMAGVNVDDEILAVGEFRVRADGWDRRLEQYPPGTSATLLLARRDRLLRLAVTFGQEPGDAWRLVPRPSASVAQLATRRAWLTGR